MLYIVTICEYKLRYIMLLVVTLLLLAHCRDMSFCTVHVRFSYRVYVDTNAYFYRPKCFTPVRDSVLRGVVCIPRCNKQGVYTAGQTHAPRQTHPLDRQPLRQTPPQADTPLGRHPRPRDGKRAVRILLECILVWKYDN